MKSLSLTKLNSMRSFLNLCLIIAFYVTLSLPLRAQETGFHIVKTFHIASPGGWDYLAVGPDDKLYVSHGTQVNILNKSTGDSLGVIPNTAGVHGIAFIASMNRGYTSNGRSNNVTVFELSTNKVLKQIPTGENPDAIMYDNVSKRIITCNGRSKNLSVINPETDMVTATIDVGGKPETAVSDDAGKIFVNIEDKNEIVEVDIRNSKVEHHWPMTPGEGPTGLALDKMTKRLFAGCDKLLVVLDATNGKIIDKLPIGDGCDGVAFDKGTNMIFTSNGEGNMTVINEKSADAFVVVENIPTKKGARTIAFDETSHSIFLPTADFGAAPAGGGRAPVIPGSFQILVLSH